MSYLMFCKKLPLNFCYYEIKLNLIFLTQKSRHPGMLLLDLFALTTSLDILFTFDFCKIEASNLQTKEVYYRT